MRCPRSFLLSVVLAAAWPALARAASPFEPGGVLAPWSGPLPFDAPASTPVSAPFDGVVKRSPGRPVPTDPNWKPLDTRAEKQRTTISAFFNPAMITFGKISARAEFAPFGPHALFFELSRLQLDIKSHGAVVTARGWEYDVGYHLFPMGPGARGFYVGPRYVRGNGTADGATVAFTGWGVDLGYQWVIADHLVVNLGAGVVYVTGTATVDDAYLAAHAPKNVDASGLRTLATGSGSYLLPAATLGFGLAL